MRHLLFLLALCLPLALTGCARSGETMMEGESGGGMTAAEAVRTAIPGDMLAGTSPSATIVENAMAVSDLSTLVEALKAADLVDVLNGPGPYTVFAPLNSAFDLTDTDEMVRMDLDPESKDKLARLLQGHVVEGKVMFGTLSEGQVVETLSGADYTVGFEDGNALEKRIGQADIMAYDIESSNGVIHVINLVLDDEGFFNQ